LAAAIKTKANRALIASTGAKPTAIPPSAAPISEPAEDAADSKARDFAEVRHQGADRNGSAPYDKRECQREETDCEIERHCRSCWITNNVHQNGQTKLAAAQPDKTGQAANGYAPSKRLLKIGTADSRLHVLFVTNFGFRDH
jgi:hypothetical protein